MKFYFKLPRAYKIPTPLGSHHPGWAVVCGGERKLFFVVETKGTLDEQQLRDVEKLKIRCGEKHFAALGRPDVVYKLAAAGDDWRE